MSHSNIHPIQSFYAKTEMPIYGIAVKLSAIDEFTAEVATAATDDILGIVFNPVYVAGDSVGVLTAVGNKCAVVTGGAVAIGDLLTVDSKGRATKGAAGNKVFAKALTAATSADQYITALFIGNETAV